MEQSKVNEVIKTVFGVNYFVEQNPNNSEIYMVRHTIGINGAISPVHAWVYVRDGYLLFRYVWKSNAEYVYKMAMPFFNTVVDFDGEFWLAKVYVPE